VLGLLEATYRIPKCQSDQLSKTLWLKWFYRKNW